MAQLVPAFSRQLGPVWSRMVSHTCLMIDRLSARKTSLCFFTWLYSRCPKSSRRGHTSMPYHFSNIRLLTALWFIRASQMATPKMWKGFPNGVDLGSRGICGHFFNPIQLVLLWSHGGVFLHYFKEVCVAFTLCRMSCLFESVKVFIFLVSLISLI